MQSRTGRKRVHRDRAAKQRAYRERVALRGSGAALLKEALTQACERGWSTFLTNRLPEEADAWMRLLAERLDGYKLVAFEVEDPEMSQTVLDLEGAPDHETPERPRFDGSTYDPELDEARLKTQLGRVLSVLREHPGQWFTPEELRGLGVPGSESGVTARLRDLRKSRFGGFRVESQRRRGAGGAWEYRLVPG
jgi:hypothetical protein